MHGVANVDVVINHGNPLEGRFIGHRPSDTDGMPGILRFHGYSTMGKRPAVSEIDVDIFDGFVSQVVAEHFKNITRIAQTLYHGALAGRHLTDVAIINRIVSMRYGRDSGDRILSGGSHISGKFAERPFLVHFTRLDCAFDDDFSMRRHQKIHCFGLGHFYGFAF